MRYCSDFQIKKDGSDISNTEDISLVTKFRECTDGYELDALYSVKWYNWEEDMLEFSKAFPDSIFIVEALGEDGIMFGAYFKNGVSQDSNPRVVYDECTF